MTKEEVKDWMRKTGYDRRNDMRREQEIAHDKDIVPEYWEYVEEIEQEMEPVKEIPEDSPLFMSVSSGQIIGRGVGAGEYTTIEGDRMAVWAGGGRFSGGRWAPSSYIVVSGGGGGCQAFIDMPGDTDEEKVESYRLHLEEQRKLKEESAAELEAIRARIIEEEEAEKAAQPKEMWMPYLQEEMERHEDKWEDIECVVPSLQVLHEEWDCGGWKPKSPGFTLWTRNRVYFPVSLGNYEEGYDFSVESVPRNPNSEVIKVE